MSIDHKWTDVPVCPHCGEKDFDWWDSLSGRDDGDVWDDTCGSCERKYKVTMSVSVQFNTKAVAAVEGMGGKRDA